MAKRRNKNLGEDVTPESAIHALKEEILSNARALAENKIMTFYPLIEATKELLVLERSLETKTKKAPEKTEDLESQF